MAINLTRLTNSKKTKVTRWACDRVIANVSRVQFCGEVPDFILVTYVVSRSESALLSSRIGKPAHVWRAHRVQGIINKSDGAEYREMASLRERDGRDVRRHLSGDSAEIAGDQETTIDPYFVQLINDNRPQTDPDATFGAEMRRITLDNDDANSSILGSRSHDAHIIAAATRALKR